MAALGGKLKLDIELPAEHLTYLPEKLLSDLPRVLGPLLELV